MKTVGTLWLLACAVALVVFFPNPDGWHWLGAGVLVACAGIIMAVGIWMPFSPLAPALKLQPLPPSYFIFLPTLLLCYCLLTQFLKKFYIRKFRSWL